MKPVVVHFINAFTSGGAERLLVETIHLQESSGFTIYVVVLNNRNSFSLYIETLFSNNVKIIDLNRHYFNPFILLDLFFLDRFLSVNIWHSHLFPCHYWLVISSFFFKKSTTIIRTEHAFDNRRLKTTIFRWIELLFAKKFDYIIAISNDIKLMLRQKLKIPDYKIRLIENGINISRVDAAFVNANIYDKNFYNILMVARFDYWQKDHKSLVLALSRMHLKYRLYFAGSGPNEMSIRNLVSELSMDDRVFFLGLRRDIYSLMKGADLNVLVTNFEGLSGVVLESLASKRPFCGSNVPGVFDVVPDNRFLFKSNSPEDISEKIFSISNSESLQESMIICGWDFVQSFDIIRMVDKTTAFYSEILSVQ